MSALDNAAHRHAAMCSTNSSSWTVQGACDCDQPDAMAELAALRTENERLRAALEIYANRANWSVVTCGRNEPYKIATWRVDETGYTIAKDALKGGKA